MSHGYPQNGLNPVPKRSSPEVRGNAAAQGVSASMARTRTCDELGLCQAKFPFAPGVINFEPGRSHLVKHRAMRRLGLMAAVAAAFTVSGLLGLALGVLAKCL
jgi:hypothetical protein